MGNTVEFSVNGGTASGHLAVPASGHGPGLVVIQVWWGLDARIRRTAADARALETRLRGMGKDVVLDVHPAGHGFMNEENPGGTHDPALAARLWPAMTAFLQEALSG
jgi:dienelactone hydrolase